MRTFIGYLNYLIATRLLFIFVGLCAFILSVDLMIYTKPVLDSRDGDPAALLTYGFLRLPEIASLVLAPSALLASLTVLAGLIRNREIVALWNSKISPAGTCLAVAPVAIVAGLLQFTLDGEAVPRSLQRLFDWGVGEYERILSNKTEDGSFWMRSGTDIVRLPELTYDVEAVDSLIIFQRSPDGRLVARIDASGIQREGTRWILTDVVRRTVKGPQVETLERMEWQTLLPLEDLRTMAAHPSELTTAQLFRFVKNKSFGLFPPHQYEVWLHQKFASGMAPIVLIFLCIILAQRIERSGGIGILFLRGLLFGFAFFILARWSQALGEASYLPPIIAAWAPVIILAIVAGSFGFHHEAGAVPVISYPTAGHDTFPTEEPNFGVIKGTEKDRRED